MPNYVPFDYNQVATQPFDPVSGIQTSDRNALTQQAQGLDLQSMMIQNQTQQQALDLARARQPNLISQSNLEGMTARATDPNQIAAGNMGAAQKQAVEGAKLKATLDSDIAAGKAKNYADAAQSRTQQMTAQYNFLRMTLPKLDAAGPPGSPQSQNAYRQILGTLPPEIQKQLPAAYGPQVRQGIMQILTDTPEHLQKLSEIAATGTQEKAVAGIRGEAEKASAKIGAESQQKVAELNVNPQKEMARTYSKIAAGDTSPGTLDEARRNTAQYISDAINKSTGAAMMMAAIEKGPEAIQNTISALNRLKENEYDRVAHPLIRGDNPFKQKNREPGKPTQSNTGIPGVNRVQ